MYQALYRKYRPASFSEVSGQPHITETLKNQIQSGRLGHAYLFTGSRGTGKTSCAKILAKAANCLQPRDGDPCGTCENCKMAQSGGMMDVLEIDAASNNGVENIRDLREMTHYTPAVGKYRVYIIDEVHMLSAGAFNALLKTLEEPPSSTLFILATTEVHKLPATILSRCQRFDFRRIPAEEIAKRLLYVAKNEQISLEDSAAMLIARLADGALRDALSLLDVCAASGEPVTEAAVAAAAGLAGREYLHRLSDAVLAAKVPDALAVLDELHAASMDMQRLCEELIAHFRNLMICKTVAEPGTLVAVSSSELDALREKARQIPLSAVFHALSVLEDTLARIGRGAPRRTEMELALIKLCNPALDSSPEALSRRMEALELAVKSGKPAFAPAQKAHTEIPSPVEKPAEKPESRSEAAPLPVPDEIPEPPSEEPAPAEKPAETGGVHHPKGEMIPCPFWPELLEMLDRTNPMIGAVLKSGEGYLQGEFLLINPRSEHFAEMVNSNPEHRRSIREAAFAVSGVQYRLGPYHPPKEEKSSDSGPKPLDKLLKKLSEAELLEEKS